MDDDLLNAHYARAEEGLRLFGSPQGTLERLRTWDLFERWLPADGVVYDVGGGAGVHSAWLADRGYDVELFDPVLRHVSEAVERSESLCSGSRFTAEQGDARRIPRRDESADAVLLLGPLYHLVEPAERAQALTEARRLLRPGGVLVAAAISRFSWLMDAYRQGLAGDERIQESVAYTLETGRSNADPTPGAFWAYFHRPDELTEEIGSAGFERVTIAGVVGFAWMLPNLGDILDDDEGARALLGQLRAIESESSMLGASSHLLARATKPA